jgi:hypothetical protein
VTAPHPAPSLLPAGLAARLAARCQPGQAALILARPGRPPLWAVLAAPAAFEAGRSVADAEALGGGEPRAPLAAVAVVRRCGCETTLYPCPN